MLVRKVVDLLVVVAIQFVIALLYHALYARHRKCQNCELWCDRYTEDVLRKNREWYALLLTAADLTGKEQHELVSMVVKRMNNDFSRN